MSSKPMESIEQRMGKYRAQAAEHERRMREDPEYRSQFEAEETRQEAERRETLKSESEKRRQDEIRYERQYAGIPDRVIPLLDAHKETTAFRIAVDFANSAGPEVLLVLAGGVGCGKTVAACCALDAYEPPADKWDRKTGQFVKAIDLARAGTFDREFWSKLEDVHLLVVDDLGTEPLDEKGWAVANLRALLDARYDSLSKTILTTNLTLEQFKARYGQDGGRLVERIRERGAFVELADASLRTPPKHWQESAEDRHVD